MVLTQYQKIEILRIHARGGTQRLIARRIKYFQSTISELIKKYMTYSGFQKWNNVFEISIFLIISPKIM